MGSHAAWAEDLHLSYLAVLHPAVAGLLQETVFGVAKPAWKAVTPQYGFPHTITRIEYVTRTLKTARAAAFMFVRTARVSQHVEMGAGPNGQYSES
jgi:hypothetical protein